MDNSQVNNLIINKSENFILSGSIQGTVVIYNNKKNLWKKKSQINDHLNVPITSLFFNDNLNIWGSAACDGYVNLYTFPTNRKICSINVDSEGLYADFLFIVSSPLPSFVIHCKNNFCFYSYSLIGKQICKEYEIDSEIYSPLIIEESNFGEILIYGDNKGRINMRYLPSLCLFFDKGISKNMDYFNVDNLEVSQNGKYCIAWNNDNDVFYVIYDNSNMSETEELMILHLANDFDD
jgi:WD40 repeat protein